MPILSAEAPNEKGGHQFWTASWRCRVELPAVIVGRGMTSDLV